MMKLPIATGVGLLLFMATMIGGPVRMSQAQDDQGGVTLASLAGKFSARGNGFFSLCFAAPITAFTTVVNCASVGAHPLPFNQTCISDSTYDAAGNSCSVQIISARNNSLYAITRVGNDKAEGARQYQS